MTLLAPEPTSARSRRVRRPHTLTRSGSSPLPLLAWAEGVVAPISESRRSRTMARVGGLVGLGALVTYLAWRILATLPPSGPGRWAAWILVAFESMPLLAATAKLSGTWSIDTVSADPVTESPLGLRVAVLIPTYDESAEVVGPTVAAACELSPIHETWVLDDGDRPWLAAMCAEYGARYVTRDEHQHAKAGNLNHALALMEAEEEAGGERTDLIAVLDSDHVPLPAFLTSTLGYFVDERLALLQAPQTFYNAGAFDDDGGVGEQSLFFNVQLAGRESSGAEIFWCGSSSILRVDALREVGGVAQETVTEDMHTTLKLQRAGWRAAFHHQNIALGLAPATPEQYLVQRRRWGMGAMQVMVHERLWRRHRWMSVRTQFEYLFGALWWLEGLGTILALMVPAVLLLTGAITSTASPATFVTVFVLAFGLRMWGYKQLLRHQIRWRSAYALRVLRVTVGLSCLWWLVTRRALTFTVTPKGGAEDRLRGRVPAVVVGMLAAAVSLVCIAVLGLLGHIPWHTSVGSTVSSGVWLVIAVVVLANATMRIRAEQYATSRRNAHRFAIPATVLLDGVATQLADLSVGGASVRIQPGVPAPSGLVRFALPRAEAVSLRVTAVVDQGASGSLVKLGLDGEDWTSLRQLALWIFHTPDLAVAGLPAGVPAAAIAAR